MLPVVAPNARIMRYGYQSQWFGKEAMQQNVSTVAGRLLLQLRRKRKVPSMFNRRRVSANFARVLRPARCCL